MSLLSNKNILVVGGTGKIGENLIKNIIANKGTVIVTSRNIEKVKKLNKKFKDMSNGSKAFVVELSKEKSIKNFIKKIKNFKIHGYVHNAYCSLSYVPVGNIPWSYWSKNALVSLASFEKIASTLVSNASNSFIESIVSTSSIYAVRAPQFNMYTSDMNPSPIYYGSIKAALLNATVYLAALWGNEGVRVNSVSPGGVLSNQKTSFLENYKKTVPLNRMVLKDEVSNAVIFLLSRKSSGINGVNLAVDAGKIIW